MYRSKSRINTMPGYNVPTPCMDCEARHPACHDHCKEYAEYRELLQAIKDKKYEHDVSMSIRPTAPQKGKGDRRK